MALKSIYRLTDGQTNELIALPETGMGYQLLSAKLEGVEGLYCVFNCEFVTKAESLADLGYAKAESAFYDCSYASSFRLNDILPLSHWPPPTGGTGTAPSALAPSPRIKRKTEAFEGFARLSAFSNDRRVQEDGSLVPDTFATTVEDLKMVPSGFAASGRYALPNPASARFVYIVVPGEEYDIDGGTVRPAHHQAGGGVEVIFTKGTPPGSVAKPYKIPEL